KLAEAVGVYRLWIEARTTGSLSALLARQRVMRAFIANMFGTIAGSEWAKAEKSYQQNPNQAYAAIRFADAVTNISRVKRDLQNQTQNMTDLSPKDHGERLAKIFGSLIKRVHA